MKKLKTNSLIPEMCRKEYAKLNTILTTKPQFFIGSVWGALKNGFPIDFAPTGSSSLLLKSLRGSENYSKYIPDFLLDCGANVNMTDTDGNNALHISIASYTPKRIIERILKNIKDIDAVNNYGQTALSLAFNRYSNVNPLELKESLNIVNMLLEAGSDCTKLTENYLNKTAENLELLSIIEKYKKVEIKSIPTQNEYCNLGCEL